MGRKEEKEGGEGREKEGRRRKGGEGREEKERKRRKGGEGRGRKEEVEGGREEEGSVFDTCTSTCIEATRTS